MKNTDKIEILNIDKDNNIMPKVERANDISKTQVVKINVYRHEHPNCAYYKKTISTPDMQIIRSTIYTPDARLHNDIDEFSGELISAYITKKEQLETLLFYLKDIMVRRAVKLLKTSDNEFVLGQISASPIYQMMNKYCSYKIFKQNSETDLFRRCIKELVRINNDEINILRELTKTIRINAIAYNEILNKEDVKKFEQYHKPYYELLKAKAGKLKTVIEIDYFKDKKSNILLKDAPVDIVISRSL